MNDVSEVEYTVLMDADAMAATIRSIALAVANNNPDIESLVMLGILRRGKPLADRLAALIERFAGYRPSVGVLSTTLYRDDLHGGGAGEAASRPGETHFDFSVDGRTVLLVDDVFAAGRTIRAAMDEIMDYGRPRRIQLACLIDRRCRELPIRPDYLGYELDTKTEEWVCVRLEETDGEDAVLLYKRFIPADDKGS